MKNLIGTIAALSVLVMLAFGSQPSSASETGAVQLPYEEIDAYFDGREWATGSTQCDGNREVTIIKPIGESTSVHWISFLKTSPMRKTDLTLRQKGDSDCGMMKCYTTYVGPASYIVMDSNYRDEDAYWIHGVEIGKGKTPGEPMDECRWFERMRVALVTEARTIYITQTADGAFEYRTFNYNAVRKTPSLIVKNGTSSINNGTESFNFNNAGYTYEVNVSASGKPFAEVLVKKDGATVQKERVLSYAYAKKS